MTVFTDNQGIMTYYEVKHMSSDEVPIYDENERAIKAAEEAEK